MARIVAATVTTKWCRCMEPPFAAQLRTQAVAASTQLCTAFPELPAQEPAVPTGTRRIVVAARIRCTAVAAVVVSFRQELGLELGASFASKLSGRPAPRFLSLLLAVAHARVVVAHVRVVAA